MAKNMRKREIHTEPHTLTRHRLSNSAPALVEVTKVQSLHREGNEICQRSSAGEEAFPPGRWVGTATHRHGGPHRPRFLSQMKTTSEILRLVQLAPGEPCG